MFGAEDRLERLVPRDVGEDDVDRALHAVVEHDVEAALRNQRAQDRTKIRVLEVQRHRMTDVLLVAGLADRGLLQLLLPRRCRGLGGRCGLGLSRRLHLGRGRRLRLVSGGWLCLGRLAGACAGADACAGGEGLSVTGAASGGAPLAIACSSVIGGSGATATEGSTGGGSMIFVVSCPGSKMTSRARAASGPRST